VLDKLDDRESWNLYARAAVRYGLSGEVTERDLKHPPAAEQSAIH
jgi:hypothetical protein